MNPRLHILAVVGARPNLMKISPILRAIEQQNRAGGGRPLKVTLCHTGQHYDLRMSDGFFEELGIPRPDVHLGVGSAPHGEQTGRIMTELEKVCVELRPDMVLVVGDVNSTLAGALVAVKLHIPAAHVEAGLRSFDRRMPEEINRIVTDVVSDLLFTTCQEANDQLVREGIAWEKVHLVGDVMVDNLLYQKKRAVGGDLLDRWGLRNGDRVRDFALMTLHRPSNVDDPQTLERLLDVLSEAAERLPIVFPAHPRTEQRLKTFDLLDRTIACDAECPCFGDRGIHLLPALGYLDILALMAASRVVLTDSGGIQSETTILDVPCLTLRDSTEQVWTIDKGTNILIGHDREAILAEVNSILSGWRKYKQEIPLADGKASERIAAILAAWGV